MLSHKFSEWNHNVDGLSSAAAIAQGPRRRRRDPGFEVRPAAGRSVCMAMPVMQVRVVRMLVVQAPMVVAVGVRLALRVARLMAVLVVRVVDVRVLVVERLVLMGMLVPLCEVQP